MGPGMGSRFLGNDEYAGPAEPGRDGFPLSRERRLGCRGWGCTGTTPGDGFPFARERRSGSRRGWVPVCTGTTVGQPGMGSRLHGNDGWGAGDGFPSARERRLGSRGWVPVCTGTTAGEAGTTAGGRERDWGCGILWGVAWECRFAGFWVCMRLYGRLAGVFFAGVAARVGGLHAGAARAVSRPFGPAAVFLSPPP